MLPLVLCVLVSQGPIVLRADVNEAARPVLVGSLSISTADTLLESNQSGASFGYNVSTAGDVNGDGYDDVIVGAFSYNGGLIYEGAAFIYHGSASGIDTIADTQFESNYPDARLGSRVSGAGDVNGDGYDDVIVGAGFFSNSIDESNEGAAFVYHGSATGVDPIADSQLESNQRSAFLDDVSGAGDVNGDGYDDVIVGFGHFDGPESNEGVAFVYYGSAAGVDAIADVRLEVNQPSAVFGYIVS
jgi:hypothetical protein